MKGHNMADDSTHNIGAYERHEIADLNLYYKNPRVGDVTAIAGSLRANGVYKPIVVNRGTHTGRPNEVLAGNHTLKAHRLLAEEEPDDKRWKKIDCWMVDVDDDRASRIVLADNRTADLGSYDNEALLDLLNGLDGEIAGTGYTDEDLSVLLDLTEGPASLEDLEAEFGEPEDDDFWITVRLRIPPVLNEQWRDWSKAYDSPEEAFEALLDKGSNYGEA